MVWQSPMFFSFPCLPLFLFLAVTLRSPHPVVENEPLLLSCNSSHRASLVETRWFHNGRLVHTSGTFCSLHGALSILRPAMSDAGCWSCQLRYSDNEVISATYNLQILGELSLCLASPPSPSCSFRVTDQPQWLQLPSTHSVLTSQVSPPCRALSSHHSTLSSLSGSGFDGPKNPVVYAAAGSAVNLPCTLSYLPSAFGISVVTAHWSRLAWGHLQDQSILQNSSSRSFPHRLPVVDLSDAGQYRCAVSVGSKTISRDVTLAVVTGERRDREVHHSSGVPSLADKPPHILVQWAWVAPADRFSPQGGIQGLYSGHCTALDC